MLPYVLLLLFLTLWVWIVKKQLNIKDIFIPSIMLIIFGTIRSNEVGTDSEMYSRVFLDNISADNFIFDERLEGGYSALVYLIQNIDKEYYLLFFFTSVIIVFFNLCSIKKYSEDFILSVYLYISFGFYTFYFNTLRQAIAMSILMLGINFLINKKTIPYLILVCFAFLFHRSALIMIPFYFLINFVNIRIEYKAIISFIISSLLASTVLIYMASINDKYSSYVEKSENAGGYSYVILYFLVCMILLYFGRKIRNENKMYNVFEQIYVCGISFCIPLILLGTNPSGPKRLVYYFLVYLIFIFPIFFKYYRSLYLKIFFVLFAFCYYIYITYNIWEVYPYMINSVFDII